MFPLGNLIEESWDNIVEKVKADKRLNLLNEVGLVAMASTCDGFNHEELIELRDKHGICGACYRMYDESSQPKLIQLKNLLS